MRNYERFYTIQEVASLTRRSVSITKTALPAFVWVGIDIFVLNFPGLV